MTEDQNPGPTGSGEETPPDATPPAQVSLREQSKLQDMWWYRAGGKSYGPVGERELAALARAGYFAKDDSVYALHIESWVRADSVRGLFDGASAATDTTAPQAPPEGTPPYPIVYAPYAGFWIRFVAAVMDGAMLRAGAAVGAVAVMRALGAGAMPRHYGLAALAGMYLVALTTASWLYYALMESSQWQATLGKRAVGIMVTDARGGRISFGRATGRYFASWISMAAAYGGYLAATIAMKRRTVHDLIADTVVIRGKGDNL